MSVDLHDTVRRWWRRSVAMPRTAYSAPKGCGLQQPADIWLLGGGLNTGGPHRRCDVAAGRPILAPVYVGIAAAGLPSPWEPLPDPGPMDVRLDGRPLTPTEIANDRPYRLHAVPGSGMRDGTLVSDRGYWVLLPGLTRGVHTLIIRMPRFRERPYLEWTLTAA
ncbi:hypothetical protein [Actinoallomurus acanthiterrae]